MVYSDIKKKVFYRQVKFPKLTLTLGLLLLVQIRHWLSMCWLYSPVYN